MSDKEKEEAEKDLDKFDLVEVGEDGKPLTPGAATQQAEGAVDKASTRDEEDYEDEGVALAEEDTEERKRERKLRKERQREYNRRRELELVELRNSNADFAKRLAQLENRGTRFDAALLNERLDTAKQQLDQANHLFSQALLGKDPGKVTEAMNVRDRARDNYVRLNDFKGQMDRAAAVQPREEQSQQQQIDPSVQRHINAFRKKHSWFDLGGSDRESRLVLMLDQEVADDGFIQNTKEYWDELEKRGAELLPHRFSGKTNGADKGGSAARRGPPVAGGGGESVSAGGKTRIYITPERKKAMMESGAWDDPVKRSRVLKQYARYDKEHAADRRA